MVIGNGLVAKGFSKYISNIHVVIFASGVSNSSNNDTSEFKREASLLQKTIQEHSEKTIIYISTCSIYDDSMQQSAYVQHKISMENLITKKARHFHIFRVSNIVGFTSNPHILLNFLYRHIKNGLHFYLWQNAFRNIIDVEDFYSMADHIIDKQLYQNQIVNIANPINYSIPNIISSLELKTGNKALYTTIDKGSAPAIDTTITEKIIKKLGLNFDINYLEKVVNKYFPNNDL